MVDILSSSQKTNKSSEQNITEKNNLLTSKPASKNIFYLGVVSFFMNISAGIVSSTIICYSSGMTNGKDFLALARNFSESLAYFAKIIVGYISDKIKNRKIFLFIGYGGMVFVKIIFVINMEFEQKLAQKVYTVNQITDRFLDATRDPIRDALICDSTVETNRYKSFGIRKLMACLGSAIGGVISGVICVLYFKVNMGMEANRVLLKTLYKFGLIPVFLSIGTLYYGVRDLFRENYLNQNAEDKKKADSQDQMALIFAYLPKMKMYFILLCIVFFVHMGKYSDALILQYAAEHGMKLVYTPFLFALYYMFLGITSYFFSLIMQKTKSSLLFMLGIISLLVFNFLMAFNPEIQSMKLRLLFFIISNLIYSVHTSLLGSNLTSVVSHVIPCKELYATYMGLLGCIMGLGGLGTTFITLAANKYAWGARIGSWLSHNMFSFIAPFFIAKNVIYFIAILPSFFAVLIFLYYRKEISKVF